MEPNLTFKFNADGELFLSAARKVDSAITGLGQSADVTAAKAKAMGDTAAASFQKTEVSAKQTAAAMRNLPAQFTDIFVSLQGGQAPLTVLFQQGGQVADMFGGVGNAARAMGGYVASLVNPFSVAAAAIGAVGIAYYQGSKEADAFRLALINTGNAAGITASEMAGLASAMGSSFGQTIGQSAEALAAMAATGQVGRASLQQFAQTAVDMEKTTGQSIEATAKIFADLGREPVTASAKLNESLNYLSATTYAQIKAAADLGETEKAAALAQDAYSKAMDGRTKNIVQNLGTLETAWRAVKGGAKEAWDAMLDVGRDKDVSTKLEEARARLQKTNDRLKSAGADSAFAPILNSDAAKQRQEIEHLTEIERMQKKAGQAAAERAATEKAGIAAINAVGKANEAALTKQERMNKELADYRKQLQALPADQRQSAEQIAKAEAAIREKYADKKTSSGMSAGESALAEANARIKANQAYLVSLQTVGAAAEKQTATELALGKVTEELTTKISGVERANKLRLKSALEKQIEQEKEIALEESNIKVLEEIAKANYEARMAALKRVDSLTEQVVKEQESVAAIGLSKEAVAELQAAKYEDAAASKERLAVMADESDASGLLGAAYRAEAEALRQLANLKREGAVKEIAATAAKKAADEWKRAADQIESSLTDALMRGFESGKSFGQNLLDSVKNLFKTLILRPQIQAVVTGSLGAMGMSLPSQAAAQASGGLGSLASTGINALGLGGAGAAFGGGLGAGFSALLGEAGIAGALDAGSIALGAGNIAGGLGTLAGALGPIVLGIAAVAAVAKKLDTSGTIHTGGSAQYSAATGVQTNIAQARTGFAYVDRRAETETMAAGVAQSIVGLLDSTATAFGKTAGYTAATAFADDTSKDGAWGALAISKGGQDLLNWNNNRQSRWAPKEFANGEEGVKQYMTAVGKDVRDMLIAETPAWADAMLQALGDAPTLEQLGGVVQQITAIQNIFMQFGRAMPQLAGLSDDAVGSLMALAGGVANLQQGLGAYMDRFYSDAEKQTLATRNMQDAMAKLGMTMPTTNAEFRALVEAQDLNTEAGRQQYAALIALAPAFDQVTSAAQKSADAAIQEAAAKAKAAADQRASLQDQLDQLTGNTAAIQARERAAIDASNLALYDQIQAINAAKAAQEAYTASLDAAQSALASATAAVASAQQTVDGIRGQATQGYLSALEQVAQIQDQIADQARQTASTYRDLAKQLREYVSGVVVPPSDAFAKALTKALGGDQAAMASLPGLAGAATDAAREGAASAAEFRLAQGRILAGVNAAADKAAAMGVETPAQKAATLQQKLIDAQNQLAEATRVANAINAPLAQTQATLITQYQSALQTLATAQAAAAKAQATLDAIRLNTLTSSDRIMGMWSAVVSGFAAMDISQDGLLSSAEFAKGMAGKATDSELQSLFKLLDSNGDGQLTYLEAVAKNTLTSSDRITGVWSAVVSGFAAMDASQDGLLSSAEFAKGMAGKATDSELQSLFKMLDINGDGQLTYLEAVVKNTALIAQRVGSGTASAIENTTTGMTQADFAKALRSEAVKQGLAASSITSSFISGQFSQLDKNGSGLLEAAESAGSASAIASAVSNLLASQSAASGGGSGSGGSSGSGAGGAATPSAAVLTAKDKEILNAAGYQAVTRPTSMPGAQIYDLYQSLLYRKPEVGGFNFWNKTYEDGIKQYGPSASPKILDNIRSAIEAAAKEASITNKASSQTHIRESFIGQGGSLFGAENAVARFFATGGAFTNGVVSTPTAFPLGVMGEAGPEAIMPLTNVNGSLGIRAQMPGSEALLEEVRALRAEVINLRAETRAGVSAAQEHLQLDRRLTRNGQSMPVTSVQNDPLQVEVLA